MTTGVDIVEEEEEDTTGGIESNNLIFIFVPSVSLSN